MYKVTIGALYNYNNSLFSGLVAALPDSANNDAIVDVILERYGELGALYPDAEATERAITAWAQSSREIFARLWATVTAEYNFLDNYDRTSTITRALEAESTGSDTASKTAFDSSQFRATDMSENAGTSATRESISENVRGNIGVTSSMQLVQQERAVAVYNFAEHVATMFAQKFTIGVW